jgi:sulfide:quinone oxidoreductase
MTIPHIVIVGGGSAGMTTAATLARRAPELKVTLIEPSEFHYYQPAWTLVGAGHYDVNATRRRTADLLPRGVEWRRQRVAGFAPESNEVTLEDGARLQYDFLIVAAGIQTNWNKVAGLQETLGKNGVTSNYSFDTAPYTARCLQEFKGGRALFTQPPMPIKCPGAPQKIAYLAADMFRRKGIKAALQFHTAGPAMFSVPFYAKALNRIVADYGIDARFGSNLVAVDGAAREATFEVSQPDGGKQRVVEKFDLIHVTPPQGAPDFIRASPLADASGFVAVDKHSLRHARYANVFGLGDCTTTPNSKTVAAIRKQVPVLVRNLLGTIRSASPDGRYDGYASCPLTTAAGKVMLAEFSYDGKITPSFPLDPRVPRGSMWWLKRRFMPYLYWNVMMQGKEWGWPPHRERTFPDQ